MNSPSPVLALWFWTFLLALHSSLVHSEQSAYSRGRVTGMVCPLPFGSRGWRDRWRWTILLPLVTRVLRKSLPRPWERSEPGNKSKCRYFRQWVLTCGQSKKSAEIRKMLGVPPTLGRDPGLGQGTLIRESSLKKYSQEDTPRGGMTHGFWWWDLILTCFPFLAVLQNYYLITIDSSSHKGSPSSNAVLSTSHKWAHATLITLRGKDSYHTHFSDEKTKA